MNVKYDIQITSDLHKNMIITSTVTVQVMPEQHGILKLAFLTSQPNGNLHADDDVQNIYFLIYRNRHPSP